MSRSRRCLVPLATMIGAGAVLASVADAQPSAAPSPPASSDATAPNPSPTASPQDNAKGDRKPAASDPDGGAAEAAEGGAAARDGGAPAPSGSPSASSVEPWLDPTALVRARCATAICLNINDQKGWLGIEPLVELPVGEEFTLNSGGLADYVNNNDLKVTFTAGLRVWILQDWVSFGVYLSQPITPKNTTVQLTGSSFQYPATYVRRPYPGLALGLLFDTLWIGLDRDELRNGGDGNSNPQYPPNAVVSGVWTWTVAIQPFTSFRTGLGTALTKNAAPASSTK